MKRLVLLVTAMLAAMFALAVSASAHVTVSAPGAVRGGSDQEITFRVPVEKNVATVSVRIQFPAATPIASVEVKSIPGWTYTIRSDKLAKPIKTDDGEVTSAVSQIGWQADGRGLAPGEYGDFTVLAGQLPDAPSVTFRVLQAYADGSTVAWNQVAAPGSSVEPQNPAPVLTLGRTSASSSDAPQGSSTSSSGDTGPVVLSIIALVVAAGTLGYVFVTLARERST